MPLILCCSGNGLCGQPLGMEDWTIPDSSITASSDWWSELPWDPYDYGQDEKGRLHAGGCWCPQTDDMHVPWFQVDLKELNQQTKVVGVITQGGFCSSGSTGWVTVFKVQYGCDQLKWHYVGGGPSQDLAQVRPIL